MGRQVDDEWGEHSLECLEREGVRVVFGYPGGAILPAYDALKHSKIPPCAGAARARRYHMADGYARASARSELRLPLQGGSDQHGHRHRHRHAGFDPIVCITGQVGSKLIGSDAFQETDITGVTLPITKHNYL